jgi:solute carrier family 25 (mitochondrial aspartate/glutamate transporter), member 12/13
MAAMAGSVKESLVGTTQEPQLSQEVKANFMKHATLDEEGELYMGQEEFIDAIAPANEDYVGYA